MNLKGEITEGAMRQGVKDSEAFIVCLTNSYLSRPCCLKELGWAIEFEKPILVVVEERVDFGLGRWNVGVQSMYARLEQQVGRGMVK